VKLVPVEIEVEAREIKQGIRANQKSNWASFGELGRWMRVENVQFRSTPRVTT
jgi:hypothetical protein